MRTRNAAVRVGVFAALVGAEVWLSQSMIASPTIRGYIDASTYSVSSSTKGLVQKIDVTLGQHVTAGQIIAELNADEIESELAIKMAKRKRLLSAGVTMLPGGTVAGGPPSDDALRVVDLELEALAEKRDALRLKSPADGVIESIDVRPGDAVSPTTPVATIVVADTRRVIACIPENRIDEVELGRVADVHSLVGNLVAQGVVESITPAVAAMPARCQPPFARIPVVGRQAVIVLDSAGRAIPGQTAMINFTSNHRDIPVMTSSNQPVASPELINLPKEIVTASRFEASGLVWVEALDRYVVISDETGIDAKHQPWLFTMSRQGNVDPEPMVIAELSEIDDAEAISADDKGGLFLLASQSQSERGHRPKAREQLSYLTFGNGGYRADKTVLLAQLLDDAPAALRASLDVPDTKLLDIEAMTYRQGELFIGLKAPTDSQGRAIVWRVTSPEKLLAGDLIGAGISVWLRAALAVEVDGRPVPGGAADMMFAPDGALLITATASGISAKHQNGVLYRVPAAAPGAAANPLVIRRFNDLRPEGIALTPTNRLAVVFDRGHEAPMWLELALP
jgi:hypothetical protein